MGKIIFPTPVKLVIGLIFKDEEFLKITKGILRRHFGAIDYESPVITFSYTDYYQKEFGNDLKRRFFGFAKLIPSQRLAAIKVLTNKIESKLARNNSRKINIDPGYITLAKLVLASTKDYSHRIYLDKGIFAEVTLVYQKNSFQPREWTYPDYRTAEYARVFLEIRKLYSQQINLKFNRVGCTGL